MAKGGGFSGGGGFKGGGFSGGGFKSGSFGGFKSGGSKPSGTNFSSFRPGRGAMPPKSSSNMHMGRSNGNNFWVGALVGSLLNNNRSSSNASVNSVFNDDYAKEAPQRAYVPPVKPVPKKREYMKCEYCGSQFSDLTLTRCANCGANLTHSSEVEKDKTTPVVNVSTYDDSRTVAKTKKKSKAGLVLFIVILAVVALVVFLGVLGSINNDPQYVDGRIGETLTGAYVNFKVLSVSTLASDGQLPTVSGMQYVVVSIQLENLYEGNLPMYQGDITLISDGAALMPIDEGGNYCAFPYTDAPEPYFTIVGHGTTVQNYLYLVSSGANLECVRYTEIEDTGMLLGEYSVYFD